MSSFTSSEQKVKMLPKPLVVITLKYLNKYFYTYVILLSLE